MSYIDRTRCGFRVALTSILIGNLCGCYSLRSFPPSELDHLSGYDIHNESTVYHQTVTHTSRGPIYGTAAATVTDRPYRVLNFEGDPMDFNSRTKLFLEVNDVGRVGGRFASIQVNEQIFSGRLLADGQLSIQALDVPRNQINRADLRVYSFGKTFALLMGISLGAAALTFGITFGVIFGGGRHYPKQDTLTGHF